MLPLCAELLRAFIPGNRASGVRGSRQLSGLEGIKRAGAPYRDSGPSFCMLCSEGRLPRGANGMSEIQVGLIVLGILVVVVVILLVWAAMICGLPCDDVGSTG